MILYWNSEDKITQGTFYNVLMTTTILTLHTFYSLNQAFIYVGVYGYPYLTAGKKVMTLFHQRGWEVVIDDNLIGNALTLMSFMVANLCGVVTMLFVQDVQGIFL